MLYLVNYMVAMFLLRFKTSICPKVCTFIRQTRSLRPQINMNKGLFQISLDVRSFKKDELRVKAVPEYVVIEGKLERKTEQGQVLRRFVRKFRLPEGCDPSTMKSTLSSDGILTIKAQRKTHDPNLPTETTIPITFSEPNKSDANESIVPPVQDIKNQNPGEDKSKK